LKDAHSRTSLYLYLCDVGLQHLYHLYLAVLMMWRQLFCWLLSLMTLFLQLSTLVDQLYKRSNIKHCHLFNDFLFFVNFFL